MSTHGMMKVQPAEKSKEVAAKLDAEAYSRTPKMLKPDNLKSDLRTPSMSTANIAAVNANSKVTSSVEKPFAATAAPAASGDTSMASKPASIKESSATTDLDLLLIGKSGVGKSATGNSILRKKVFKSSASLNSETDKISVDVSKVKGQIVKVVDGPGVGDTRMDTEDGIRLFVESMEHAMIANPSGYHTLLLVLRFGTRFTREDEATVALLKKVFGDEFVKNYCIIVMTCGDMFKYEMEETGEDFHQWVGQQEGQMADLVAECQGRIVLFDNVTKNDEEKSAQMDRLFEAVGRLNNNGKRYTDSNFQGAMKAREKLIAESKVPLAQDATLQAIALLMQGLGDIRERARGNEDAAASASVVEDLEKLLKDAITLREDVTAQDMGTGALKDLLRNLETAERSIQSSLSLHREMMESRRKQQESEIELARQMDELQQEMGNAQEEEKARLERENEKLKLQLERMMAERQRYKAMYFETQETLLLEHQRNQQVFYHYQAEREGIIHRTIRKTWRYVKQITRAMIGFFDPY